MAVDNSAVAEKHLLEQCVVELEILESMHDDVEIFGILNSLGEKYGAQLSYIGENLVHYHFYNNEEKSVGVRAIGLMDEAKELDFIFPLPKVF